MDLAEDTEVLRHMPTVIVLATLDSSLPWHVLPPVRTLVRLNLLSNGPLEVLVADPTVSVRIKVVEEVAKLLFGGDHSPVLQVEAKVFRHNRSILADIESHECLTHGLPLVVDLGNNLLDQLLVIGLLALIQVFLWVLEIEALRVEVERRVDHF